MITLKKTFGSFTLHTVVSKSMVVHFSFFFLFFFFLKEASSCSHTCLHQDSNHVNGIAKWADPK